MSAKENFLSNQQRYQPLVLPQRFPDEEMVRDWTLTKHDYLEVNKYRKRYQLGIAIQLCFMRLYGRFLSNIQDLSPRVVNYLSNQLKLPPTLTIAIPDREATVLKHRKRILTYLGFRKFDDKVTSKLNCWIEEQANQGVLPNELFQKAEHYLLLNRIVLPGPSTIERQIIRNVWEMGLALAMRDAFRSGDLYLPQSKQHISFWDLTLNDMSWDETLPTVYTELQQPQPHEVRDHILGQFNDSSSHAKQRFGIDDFAEIQNGKLKLKRYDKLELPDKVNPLQKVIDANLPTIRIEKLLMEVDQMTHYSRHFIPLQQHQSRPKEFYKSLIATIISQATNLGVVSMSSSVKGITVDMLRHVLHYYLREETLTSASAQIVNCHHELPLSSVHGSGTLSSSDAQRFKIRADSLLASYYPRYYGYYEKAIGIYTHVSDQYSVFSTKIISCSPREALYVLDGLLENNTILKIREHTTDTHGYTEIVFALCHLLGFYFMPRIRDLKDQQLYRVDKSANYGDISQLLTKTADLAIIEEQWESMMRVAISLKKKTAPAHIIVQRLTNSYPSDRLTKAFTNLGRIIKTEYILRYLTDKELRRTVQRQLNKGEYRHKLPRWIFFADQGEFTTGDYEEIMNKASSLSFVSNAILYWNTLKINDIVEELKQQGEDIDDETLSHISLLPYKHVLPNGTYFIEE